MEQRLADFIAGLRAAGVRISIAESADAFLAVQAMGIGDRDSFRTSLRSTLVKEGSDLPIFDKLFPLYFGSGGPPLINPLDDLTPEQKQMLAAALRALLEQMGQDMRREQEGRQGQPSPQSQLSNLMQLLQMLLAGQSPSSEQMDQMGQRAGLPNASHPYQQQWIQRRMMRQMGMDRLEELLDQLWQMLAEMGMSQEAIEQLRAMVEANRDALAEQVGHHVGGSIARQAAETQPQSPQHDLMHRPFQSLSEQEAEELREQVRRLAAQLRSRAALRQKRGKTGTLDAKKTIRANLRYGGVPLELKFKTRHLKPKLVLICDVSTSMRPVVEFMLRMVYELQDQVAKARSFAFIDDIEEISEEFNEHRPDVALDIVLQRMQPGYYNTDLGYSLAHFTEQYFDSVDSRTTVIIVGDGRNNFNNPRLDCMDRIKRRARRVLWFNPEHPRQWGSGDSDMPKYVPYCDRVHRVSTLAELTDAVDR
ncbi:MAG: VWA domain-containing protein, partial [Anaerolineae bacterium]